MALQPTSFIAGPFGPWQITDIHPVRGESLPKVPALRMSAVSRAEDGDGWMLRGTASNLRYTSQEGVTELRAVQSGLGRPEATRAALIPITKSAAWWALAQDERIGVFRRAKHHSIGLPYVRPVARALYHSRDLGEPFDFLTWFEYAPEDESAFDRLLVELRASEEWGYVEREVDIRLTRA
ncbi:MAG: chlorite dismutase family protein [Novosphingobium sp.]